MIRQKQKSKHPPCTGHFVLRNNQSSPVQTAVKIKGILVSEEYYLDIDSLLKTPVSKTEALNYGRRLNLRLPTKKQIQWLESQAQIVNNRLLSIGRGDCLLLGNILNEFWTLCDSVDANPQRRGVLFLVPLHQK